MQQLKLHRMDDYLGMIQHDEQVRKTCIRLLGVSISRFFRDITLWGSLEKEVIPDMVARVSPGTIFRVWSCGCARGEEVYSFLMVWDHLARSGYQLPEIEIFATDINPGYVAMAKEGVYTTRSLKELPGLFLSQYFKKSSGKYKLKIRPELRDKLVFKEHDFLKDPSLTEKFHVIFLRNNLLTYYNPPDKETAFEKITAGLLPGGVLIVGSNEKIPQNVLFLKRYAGLPWFYFREKPC